MKRLQRLYNGAQRRFEASSRRWKLIQETQRGSNVRMLDWTKAHLRWARAAERQAERVGLPFLDQGRPYEPPRATAVGNLRDLLAYVPHGHRDN